MRILFFIECLQTGGKERRLLELIYYLENHSDNEMLIVITDENIHYQYANTLKTRIEVLKRKGLKKDPRIFFKFYKLCNDFRPDVIHTWGSMLAFYALPAIIIKKIPHINSHIADVPVVGKKFGFQYFVTWLGFKYSTLILSNTHAGLKAYGLSGKKCRVIPNGIRLERFSDLPEAESIKIQFKIQTPFAVIMVASFSPVKKYDQFLDVAEYLQPLRSDITFISAGGPLGSSNEYEKIIKRASLMGNVIICGRINNVEALVNTCDIGVLFSQSEGLSNSILEYMACGKPVIASNAGGTREIVVDKKTGYLIHNETPEEIAEMITDLLDHKEKRNEIGENARFHIEKHFTVDRMGRDFSNLYSEVLP